MQKVAYEEYICSYVLVKIDLKVEVIHVGI